MFVEESFQKQNIPTLNSEAIYPVEYLEDLLTGFGKGYHSFLDCRKFLPGNENSPLNCFTNNTIRFIWRDTSLYIRINKQMKIPENLRNKKQYEQKIRNYLSVALKNVPEDFEYQKSLIIESYK